MGNVFNGKFQIPLLWAIGACLLMCICNCLCCFFYRRRLLKKHTNSDKHVKTRSHSLSEHSALHRKGSNDSDFDILPLTETTLGNTKSDAIAITNNNKRQSAANKPMLEKEQNSVVTHANAMYGINADALSQTRIKNKKITDSPSLVVIQHKSMKNLSNKSSYRQSMETAMLPTYDPRANSHSVFAYDRSIKMEGYMIRKMESQELNEYEEPKQSMDDEEKQSS